MAATAETRRGLRARTYAPIVVRLSMSAVFLWFGISQLTDTANFLGYLPDALFSSPYARSFVIGNGIIEIVLGAMLALGVLTRPVALVLALHLIVIAFGLGYGDTMIRDLGLAAATLSIAFHGNDDWCLKKMRM